MPETAKIIEHCEVCGARDLPLALDLGRHPLCDDLVPIGDPRQCREYPIEILFCDHCVTAHQRVQVSKAMLVPPSYHYRARQTGDVLNGMRDLVLAHEAAFGPVAGRKVLDIGCNDGSLLSIFREKGAITFGVEPTDAARDAIAGGHAVIHDFFSEDVATGFAERCGQPDVICFTNVFAHIDDLRSLIDNLRILIGPETTVVIEYHYLGAIIDKYQFDTFYHEHPRTYSYTSFRHIADKLGMSIAKVEFPRRYGGNIRVFLRGKNLAEATDDKPLREREAGYGRALRDLPAAIAAWRANKLDELDAEFTRHGSLPAKAFPGRAAILLKLLGLDASRIEAVYEKPGSMKIGHYLPGTRIPIRSDDDFRADQADARPLINLAWHIPAEIHAYMRQRGYCGRIIDIVGADDFRPQH
jgi:SAM-dependent methyltransferase